MADRYDPAHALQPCCGQRVHIDHILDDDPAHHTDTCNEKDPER